MVYFTKAFDRFRFDKHFEILNERKVHACIRILIDMYARQTVRTVREGCVSDEFSESTVFILRRVPGLVKYKDVLNMCHGVDDGCWSQEANYS